MKAEFCRLAEENVSAPAGQRLTEGEMLIDPGYEEMLERQGKELCEEAGYPIPQRVSLTLLSPMYESQVPRAGYLHGIHALVWLVLRLYCV